MATPDLTTATLRVRLTPLERVAGPHGDDGPAARIASDRA